MAGSIKGITIEFNGDTTKLGKALKQVNDQAKGIDKDLRAVNRDLKFNPKNTELLAQKQTLLKQKIEQTKGQLEAFKRAEQSMRESGADENSRDFMELRRNIIEAESKLQHFNAELKKAARVKFEQVGASVKAVGDKTQAVGKGMSKYVTAPIVAAGAASVKAFNEVKDGLNIVTQKTGATGQALKNMQTSARNLAKSIPTDFETAGTAVGEVNTRFGLTGKALEDLSGQFIKFAKVNDTDVNTSIDQTQKALSAFGLSAKEAPALLDAMTRAGQNTGVSMDKLQEGLIQNGTALQQLGLNVDQSVNFMAQLEKSGANSETVMNGLRKALKNATKDGKPLDKALSELQNTIKNGKGDVDGLTAAYDLFGKSGDQIYGAVKAGTIDFAALGQSVGDSKGALDAVFNETLTPAEQWQKTMNAVKDTGYEVGNNLMTFLSPVLEKIAAGVQKVSDWWQKLDEDQQNMIIKIALVVAALGPVVTVIGKITSGVGALITVLPMLLSPAGLVVAALAAIVAAGVVLVKNWDKIKAAAKRLGDWLSGVWNGIKQKTAAAWNAIKDAILRPFNAAKKAIKWIIDKIKGFLHFKFELPQIPLPHFDIKPEGWKIRDLLHGEIPSLGIDWYDKGGIFKSPSVIGVGEKRPEFVGALDDLRKIFREEMSGGDNIQIIVNASPDMDINQLATKIEQKLAQRQKRKRAAYGSI